MSSAGGLLFVSPTGTMKVPVPSTLTFLATPGLILIPVPAESVNGAPLNEGATETFGLTLDSNFDLTYSLADTLILGKVSYYNDPDDYEIELQLSNEDIDHLIKAKNALSDVDNMLISSAEDMDGNKVCEFLFGDNEGFSNKITYQLQGTIKKDSITLPFNSNIFKDILNANKDMSYGTLKLSEAGMIKLNFYSDDDLMSSEYFVARNE